MLAPPVQTARGACPHVHPVIDAYACFPPEYIAPPIGNWWRQSVSSVVAVDDIVTRHIDYVVLSAWRSFRFVRRRSSPTRRRTHPLGRTTRTNPSQDKSTPRQSTTRTNSILWQVLLRHSHPPSLFTSHYCFWLSRCANIINFKIGVEWILKCCIYTSLRPLVIMFTLRLVLMAYSLSVKNAGKR